MTPAALELRNVTVHAGRQRLLEVEHLRVATGSVVALMGPNGAGKTTLLRTCLGLASPSGGDVAVLGEEVRSLRGAALAGLRRRIGYVPQLLPARSELPLTVREVVAIGRTARAGWFRPLSRDDWRTVDAWIERLGLTALAGRAFARNGILDAVWGNSVMVTERFVDRCVTTLLSKIEPDARHPTYISTVRDVGYRFDAEPTDA